MDLRLQTAIKNNNDLYEAIFKGHNLRPDNNGSIWYCLEQTPPLYSNLVTVSGNWRPDDIFQTIDQNYEKEHWDEWSIKDSFQVLDLKDYGFDKLFDAQWTYLEANQFNPAGASSLQYKIIKSEDELTQWRLAWDIDEQLGKTIFNSDLLTNPEVYFIAGYQDDQIVNGCFLNKTDQVLGISNFFAPNQDIAYWSGMISFIHTAVGYVDIVGYERMELVQGLNKLGFETIGNLTVWLKKRNS